VNKNTRYAILTLAGLTNAIVIAVPSMGLPVLFAEISNDLRLTLVQVGVIWGISSLPGILTSLLGGAVVDRLGPRRVLVASIVMVALTGALRGLANSYIFLVIAVFLSGLLIPFVSMSTIKTCSLWFDRKQLGLANGVLSMGMAFGFLLGSLLSATIFSPWLGGWRNVFIFYGGVAVLLIIPWLLAPPPPVSPFAGRQMPSSMRVAIGHISRLKNVWLLGIGIFGLGGCVQAALGYLPLYLRSLGWSANLADVALSTFHLMSLIFVLPIALLSDRLGARKKIVLVMSAMIVTGIGMLSVVNGPGVWFSVTLAGMVRDGFMALFITMVVETDGVGPRFAGTATGFVMIFSMLGSLIAPPIGNTLATINPGLPFLFWAGLGAVGAVCLSLTRLPLHQNIPAIEDTAA